MHSSEAIKRVTALNSTLPGDSRDWRSTIEQSDHTRALSQIELTLSLHPDDLEARLWWVRCQLEGGQLPLGALTSPLEEIITPLRAQTSLHAIACKTFLLLGSRLIERGQSRLAVLMLERADEFCVDGCVDVEARTCVRQVLLKALSMELERARTRLESASYIAELEEKKASVAQREISPKEAEAPKTSKKKAKLLSSKSIIAASASEVSNETSVSPEDVTPQFPLRDDIVAPNIENNSANHSKRIAMTLGAVATVLIVFAVWQFIGSTEQEALANLTMKTVTISSRHLDTPVLSPSLPATSSEHFDSIKSRLDKLGSGRNGSGNSQAGPNNDSVDNLMKSPEVDSAALQNAAPLAPVSQPTAQEPNSLEPIGPSKSEIAAKTPLLDPDRLAKLPVEDAGSSPRTGSSRNPYVRGADGRLYGPSVGTGQAAPTNGAKALDGSPLRSYEVEQFENPVYFKVIAPTDVLDAPSSLATAVGKLEPNARVQVVSRMGNWLELRSTGGKRGYIYAQDASQMR